MTSSNQRATTKAIDLWVNKLVPKLESNLSKIYPPGKTKRFFHPKMHGLLRAEFIINPNLPKHLKEGVFAVEKTYPTWIRYSSSSHKVKSDLKKSFRGMAIKLMDVPGEKLLEGHEDAETQDFIAVNAEILNAHSLRNAAQAILALTGNLFTKIWFAITHLGEVLKMFKKGSFVNLLYIQYWSQAPIAFGERIIKYSVIPRDTSDPEINHHGVPEYLRLELIKDLSKGDHWFDFAIQFREDPESMPMEDLSVKWNSPFHKVASIRIPKQEFDTPKQVAFGERLCFNTWHAIAQHRPLGSINLARAQVYEIMSKYRNQRNNQPHEEPTSSTKP
jgi:hypothetical protein